MLNQVSENRKGNQMNMTEEDQMKHDSGGFPYIQLNLRSTQIANESPETHKELMELK